MPTCRRKRVLLTQPTDDLLAAAHSDPAREVYYLAQTGEIFDSYDTYSARMSFYQLKQFQCEVTGKSGLDYFQALESEQEEARTLQSRFPEPLKAAVLRSVQWQVMGRLDHLVEAVYERFKDRYFEGEKVFIDVQGDKFTASVAEVYPPKSLIASMPKSPSLKRKRASSSASASSSSEVDAPIPFHSIGGDFSIPLQESLERDNPKKYFYKVQILEQEKRDESEKANGSRGDRRESGRMRADKCKTNVPEADSESKAKWSGSLMEVQCHVMSRDRLAFSKSLLRRFLRECLDRDSSLASPWTVKPTLAARYGLSTEMPDNIREGVQKVRQGEIDKRKRVWEEKELQAERAGIYTKKMQKRDEREARAALKAAEAEARQREAAAKAERIARVKEEKVAAELAARLEAERIAAEKSAAKMKKKPVRYPTEDLDVRISEKDLRAGMKMVRPVPGRGPDKLPFSESEGALEGFLVTWNFLMCFGHPFHLSSFTLDDYEHALRHPVSDPPCALLADIHSVLIYNLRTIPFTRHAAVLSLLEEKRRQAEGEVDVDVEATSKWPSVDELVAAMADVGNNWERVPLKHTEGRYGWEEALIGCLKDHATVRTFPRLRSIFTQLLFAPAEEAASPAPMESLPNSRQSSPALTIAVSPTTRFHTLSSADRVEILQFMCDLAVSSKAVHAHMESCEEQLTALRKEKIEVNRQKKQIMEEIAALTGEKAEEELKTEEQPAVAESSDLESEGRAGSEDISENGSAAGRRISSTSRQLALRVKAQQGQMLAKQRELERAKNASAKAAQAEARRLDEELSKHERRLESIERDFRKLLGVVRLKPLGRDRFYNRIWWFDGCGGSSLLGSGGVVQYGSGRIFIQGPSEFDADILSRREPGEVEMRRREEEGEAGILHPGDWGVFTEVEELEDFVAWLNPKGLREYALKNTLTKWWDHIVPGMRKRVADVATTAKLPEARRSMRGRTSTSDLSREPYMLWVNRKATN